MSNSINNHKDPSDLSHHRSVDIFDEDDKNTEYITNPNISKEDNENYLKYGQLPVIGVCMGPKGQSVEGKNVQKAAYIERQQFKNIH